MNTKTFEQFDVMTDAELSTVEGGGWVKCGLGTAGSAGLGFLSGASVGTVTLPIVGTVSGAAVGGWSGAAVGAATFCWKSMRKLLQIKHYPIFIFIIVGYLNLFKNLTFPLYILNIIGLIGFLMILYEYGKK